MLQPSRRDVFNPPGRGDLPATVRHHGQSLRSRDPGYVDGRFATPQPNTIGPSPLVGGEAGGDDDTGESVVGENDDRHTLANLRTQVWPLSYIPISETLHVHWHPGAGAGVEWKQDEHYFIDEDDNVITIYADTLAAAQAEVGDVFSAQYLRLEGEQDAPSELEDLVLRGANDSVVPGDTVPLPAGTEIGDLLIVGSAVMRSDGLPGLVVPNDGRLTRLSHNTWIGTVTNLGGVLFEDFGADDRFQGVVATFASPANYQSNAAAGPADDAASPMSSPVVGASAAILVGTTENPNGTGGFNSVPGAWVAAFTGTAVSTVQIWYWIDTAASTSPAGGLAYNTHGADGFAYATVIGLQGE